MAINANLPDNITPHAKELYDECQKLTSPDDINRVIDLLEQAIADSPDSRLILIKLAVSYRQSGSTGKAIKLLEGVPDKFSDDIEIQHELANSYSERKWNKKAKQKYMECLEKSSIYPELIQDFAESCLDLCEYEFLSEKLSWLINRFSEPFDTDLTAMCMAMIYSQINDCSDKHMNCVFTSDFIKEYIDQNRNNISASFFIKTISYLSETPNDSSIFPLFHHLTDIIVKEMPGISDNQEFNKAIVDFEISIILFSSDVTPLTILAMRTSRYIFRSREENIDELNYLIFDAKLRIIDLIKTNYLNTGNADSFKQKYPNLWKLISEFITGAFNSSDLKKYSQSFIYYTMINATPAFIELLKKNLPSESFEKLIQYRNLKPVQPQTQKKTNKTVPHKSSTTIHSSKIAPNSPCPCGSGKKYKKCCGLKK